LNPSYEVHFYDKEERQKMDCFDAKTAFAVLWLAAHLENNL